MSSRAGGGGGIGKLPLKRFPDKRSKDTDPILTETEEAQTEKAAAAAELSSVLSYSWQYELQTMAGRSWICSSVNPKPFRAAASAFRKTSASDQEESATKSTGSSLTVAQHKP
eukprot:6007098-Pyramimonas_sp.AAC.1